MSPFFPTAMLLLATNGAQVIVLSRKLSLAATRLFISAHVYAQSTFGIVIITAFLSAQVRAGAGCTLLLRQVSRLRARSICRLNGLGARTVGTPHPLIRSAPLLRSPALTRAGLRPAV